MAKGNKSGGRVKGTPNKTTALLKDAILDAAALAGGKAGLTGYLETQARQNPGPFMSLLGKVLPTQLTGAGHGPIEMVTRVERHIIDPEGGDDPENPDPAGVPAAAEPEEV